MKPMLTSWLEGSVPPLATSPTRGLRPVLPDALLGRWRRAVEAWGAGKASIAALDRLADPETAVVVTGQQPGILGGPLYSRYKTSTAVALAQRLEESGRPAVAVFWMGADDADWDEVAWATLPRRDLSLVRERFSSPLAGSRRWVGGAAVNLPESLQAVFDEWSRPRPDEAGMDLADVFARSLLDQFSERGLLVLDSRWPELRMAGAPLWRRYVDSHERLAEAVIEAGAQSDEGGPAIAPKESDRGLFLMEGDRRLETPDAEWESAARARLETDGGESLAPSVLLRAPLQDFLLAPTVHVVGHGEIGYLSQLAPLYRGLDVAPPARVHRLHATLVPAGLIPDDRLKIAVQDPEAWVGEVGTAALPSSILAELTRLRSRIGSDLQEWNAQSEAWSKGFGEVGRSAAKKIDQQFGRLGEALDRRARQSLYARTPRLRHLPEFLRPRRGSQDRGLSGTTLDFFFGSSVPEVLDAAARAHLDHLRGGRLHHFVLEAPQ